MVTTYNITPLLIWWLFYYYLSIYFCIWTRCKFRYFDFIWRMYFSYRLSTTNFDYNYHTKKVRKGKNFKIDSGIFVYWLFWQRLLWNNSIYLKTHILYSLSNKTDVIIWYRDILDFNWILNASKLKFLAPPCRGVPIFTGRCQPLIHTHINIGLTYDLLIAIYQLF